MKKTFALMMGFLAVTSAYGMHNDNTGNTKDLLEPNKPQKTQDIKEFLVKAKTLTTQVRETPTIALELLGCYYSISDFEKKGKEAFLESHPQDFENVLKKLWRELELKIKKYSREIEISCDKELETLQKQINTANETLDGLQATLKEWEKKEIKNINDLLACHWDKPELRIDDSKFVKTHYFYEGQTGKKFQPFLEADEVVRKYWQSRTSIEEQIPQFLNRKDAFFKELEVIKKRSQAWQEEGQAMNIIWDATLYALPVDKEKNWFAFDQASKKACSTEYFLKIWNERTGKISSNLKEWAWDKFGPNDLTQEYFDRVVRPKISEQLKDGVKVKFNELNEENEQALIKALILMAFDPSWEPKDQGDINHQLIYDYYNKKGQSDTEKKASEQELQKDKEEKRNKLRTPSVPVF